MSGLAGYSFKQILPYKGIGVTPQVCVSPALALPATTTANVFTITYDVLILELWGIVSTALGSATPAKLSMGVGSNATALAAAMAAAASGSAAGDLIQLPATLGAAMPAPVSAKGSAATAEPFVINGGSGGTHITLTTDATNTGAISWACVWMPLNRKVPGTVAAS